MKAQNDILVKTKPLLEMVNKPWEDFLAIDAQEPEIELFSAWTKKLFRHGFEFQVNSSNLKWWTMPVVNTNVQVFVQALFRKHERTGRLLGVDSFIAPMELLLGRKLKPQKPGPKKKDK